MSEMDIMDKTDLLCEADGTSLVDDYWFDNDGEEIESFLMLQCLSKMSVHYLLLTTPQVERRSNAFGVIVKKKCDCLDQARRVMHLDHFIKLWITTFLIESFLTFWWVKNQLTTKS